MGQICDNRALFARAGPFGDWDSRAGDEPAEAAPARNAVAARARIEASKRVGDILSFEQ